MFDGKRTALKGAAMWELVLDSDGCVSVLFKLWYTRLFGPFINDRIREISQHCEGTAQFLSL